MGSLDLLGGQTSAFLDTEAVISKFNKGTLSRSADRDWDLALVLFAVLHPLGLQTVETTLRLVHGCGQ